MTGSILIMYNQNDVQTFHKSVLPGAQRHHNFAWSKTTIMKHEYQISGMTCGSCIATVERQLSSIPGITSAKAKLDPPGVTLTMDHHVPIEKLQDALKDHPKYRISEIRQAPMAVAVMDEEKRSLWETYKPIILVFAFITGVTLLNEAADGAFNWMRWMRYFMAGFFLVFSFFKLLDLTSFATSYSSYDVIAKKWFTWGFIYPFIELSLGILYLINFDMVFTSAVTFVVMGISSIGVFQSIMAKRKIRCACLGAVFNLPMSTITLIEDLLMVAMAGIMLLYHYI